MVGLATEFRSEKIPRNRIGMASVIPRKKELIPSLTERNSEHFSPLRNGSEQNSESFLFYGMVQNGNPRVFFYFCSMVQNSEHSSLLRNGSERNSESFLFRGTAGIPPEQTNCSVYSVFRGIIFLSEIANPSRWREVETGK